MLSIVVAAINNLGSIAAAWVLTALALGAYVVALLARARRARLRAETMAERRDRPPSAASGS